MVREQDGLTMEKSKNGLVVRMPPELESVIFDRFQKQLANNGIKMNKTDLMRNFANNVILPHDDIGKVARVLNEASKKK